MDTEKLKAVITETLFNDPYLVTAKDDGERKVYEDLTLAEAYHIASEIIRKFNHPSA